MAHLSTGRLNLVILRETARRELLRCLDKCSGTKAVVFDEPLIRQLGLITDGALLKDHNVLQLSSLERGVVSYGSVKNVIFLTRPNLSIMDTIADNVHKADAQGGSSQKEFHIFFVPRKSVLCEQRLQDRGVYGNFTIKEECCIELFPVDNDLISMELDTAFRDCHLEYDMTSMFHISKALMSIQAVYGVIPTIYGKGKCAKHVYDLMLRMRREMAGQEAPIAPQIDALLLIDREVDMITPLITQMTYEGLIDEMYGIHLTMVKVPMEKFHQQQERNSQHPGLSTEDSKKEIILNSGEELYSEIRDRHFKAATLQLSKKAKLITSQFDERHNATSISEMKQFVNKLPHLQALRQSVSNHTTIGQLIKNVVSTDEFQEAKITEQEFLNYIDTDKVSPYIDECIAKEDSLIKILRLICLQSLTNSGLKLKVLEYYKREILQTYGFQYMLTLENLEKVGLLEVTSSKTYAVLRKTLRTVIDDFNEQSPNDIAYVYDGYAPISIRLAQCLSKPGWRSYHDVLAMLPGPTIEDTQQIPVGLRKRRGSGSSSQSSVDDQKLTLIFFLGGCTFAEIAALRFLSQQEDASTDYVIATTKIINGTNFVQSLMDLIKV